ncbi:MAG TPA: Ig-like domain-containing protein, partial [Longimicrobiales bacterium]
VRLRGLPLFASGDTVPNVLAAWAGDGGSIIRVGPDGLVTALREGQGTATASYQTLTRATRVRVQAVVARILLSADTFSLMVDSTRTLAAVARDRNGNQLQRTFSWSSSSSSVATVDASGVVKGVAAGTATIIARSEAQSASATVTVRRIAVAAVSLTPASATLLPGDSVRLTATTVDAAGAILSGRLVTWSSGNAAVATVDTTGLVRGVASGSTTITATSEGKSGTAAIQVVQPLVAVGATSALIPVSLGGAAAGRSIAVTNGGTGMLTGLTSSVAYSGMYSGWLSASLGSTTAPTTLTLTAASGALGTGTYSATVTVASSVRGAGSGTIAVQMIVQNPGPAIGISPGAITLHMPWDTASVAISNTGGGSLTGLSASVTGQSGFGCPVGTTTWLSAWVSPTTAPARLVLNASGTGSPGLGCSAVVTVRSTVPGVSPATLSVTYQ